MDGHPFLLTGSRINGEENEAAENLSRISLPVPMPIAVEFVKLEGELERDSEAEEESDSFIEEGAKSID